MKNIKVIVLSISVLAVIAVASAFTNTNSTSDSHELKVEACKSKQTINLFVTHGHCSTPFAGIVEDLEVVTQLQEGIGNSLEGMTISFKIDPESFNVCASEDLTARIKTPGLFIGKKEDKITFRSTQVYTMGLDWYQVNGKMGIKGVERDVKFFVSGIRDPKSSFTNSLVLEGQLDLADWGIDYDQIVSGQPSEVPTKWMHLNMNVNLSERCKSV